MQSKSGSSSSTSSNSGDTTQNMAPPPHDDPLSMPTQQYSQFTSSEFKHTLPSQEHTSPPANTSLGGGEGGAVMASRNLMSGSGMVPGVENKGRKDDYSSEILPQAPFQQDTTQMIAGMPIPLEPSLQGLGHSIGMTSESSSPGSTETFGSLLGSQDDSSLQQQQQQQPVGQQQAVRMRYTSMENEPSSIGAAARSLSHPNLTSIPSRTLSSRVTQSSTTIPTHSQAPIPFPANLGGFTLSSMMGHFTSPQLQPQSLSMNPAAAVAAGGIMQGLQGVSVGSVSPSTNPTITAAGGLMQGISVGGPSPSMNPGAITAGGLMQGLQGVSVGGGSSANPSAPQPPQGGSLSIVNPQGSSVSGLLGNASSQTIPIMNPPVSGTRTNLPPNSSLPMPLTHPIAGNLQNPTGLPLISGMPNMYSYPYTAALPAQPVSSAAVRVNAPGFPSQPLYSQYLPPSLYGGGNPPPQQPPVSTGNFSR